MSPRLKYSGYIGLNRLLLSGARSIFHRTAAKPLVLPKTQAELAKWMSDEARRRERLDTAVLEWLIRYRWPRDLDAQDRWLLSARLFYAIDWLHAADAMPCSLLPALPDRPADILAALLIDVWRDAFLADYEGKLQHLVHTHRDGFAEGRTLFFST